MTLEIRELNIKVQLGSPEQEASSVSPPQEASSRDPAQETLIARAVEEVLRIQRSQKER